MAGGSASLVAAVHKATCNVTAFFVCRVASVVRHWCISGVPPELLGVPALAVGDLIEAT